jgi:hypothetical protein
MYWDDARDEYVVREKNGNMVVGTYGNVPSALDALLFGEEETT